MCGIVGILPTEPAGISWPDIDLFENMLITDTIRGSDGTGVFHITASREIMWGKVGAPPFRLINRPNWQKFKNTAFQEARLLIGHNRKAVMGTVSSENAHPFVHEHIIAVHNGFIDNHASFGTFDVDSMAIPQVLASEEDPVKALQKFVGAFAIVWYNALTHKLYIVRNAARPLCYVKTSRNYIIASEQGMLEWLMTRETPPRVGTERKDFEIGMVYEFDLHTRILSELGRYPATAYASCRPVIGTWGGWDDVYEDFAATNEPIDTVSHTPKHTIKVKSIIGETLVFDFAGLRPGIVTGLMSGGKDLSCIKIAMAPGFTPTPEDLKIWKRTKLMGKVSHSEYYASGLMVHWLENCSPVHMYRTWNGIKLNAVEWRMISKTNHCTSCGGNIPLNHIKFTSLTFSDQEKLKIKRIFCPVCLHKKYETYTPKMKEQLRGLNGYSPADYLNESPTSQPVPIAAP